jgi:translation initiation factor 2B subunit (eIF-2B alpha/beta/delta family)
MNVSELLSNRLYLKIAIEDLIDFLKAAKGVATDQIDVVMATLLKYIDDHQRYLVMVAESNTKTIIKVGNSKVSVSNAIKVREGIKQKIDALSTLMDAKNEYLNVLDLMEQRKKFFDEYILLSQTIAKSDLETIID